MINEVVAPSELKYHQENCFILLPAVGSKIDEHLIQQQVLPRMEALSKEKNFGFLIRVLSLSDNKLGLILHLNTTWFGAVSPILSQIKQILQSEFNLNVVPAKKEFSPDLTLIEA